MAPRKEKTEKAEKASADQGTALIVDYLKKQKFATDISANLHNKVTKSYAAKALKTLHDSQLIAGKASGKQIIYHTLQSAEDNLSAADLAALDTTITDLKDRIVTLKAEDKRLRSSLASLNATLSPEELRASISALEAEKAEILKRLIPLREGNVKPVVVEEREEVDRLWRFWKCKMEVRRKITLELWALLTEVVPEGKTKKDLWDEWGMEGSL